MAKGVISAKQQEILDFIKEETLTRGYPPAVREICQAVNLKSPASVHAHLATLEKMGLIKRDPSKPRAIEIMDFKRDTVTVTTEIPETSESDVSTPEVASIPIVGNVAAGEPILAEQNIRDYFPLPTSMLPNSQVFMLKVRGESMINAGILDGDLVVVKQANTAYNGDMVVALIEDGATVKYFYKENGHFRLQPDNPDYEPIIVSECQILGTVIGVIRMF